MQKKYVKVTEKDGRSFIVLASNEQFYKKRGATIEAPTQEEIEKCFPEEAANTAQKTGVNAADTSALKAEKEAHEATKHKHDAEIFAHDETKRKLDAANAILQAKNEELENVKSELEGLKKKSAKEVK